MENSKQEKPKPKLPKIKTFTTIQKNYAIVGIGPELTSQSYPFNGKTSKKIFRQFLILTLALIFECVFIFNYAETFFEYTQSIYIASAVILFILIFVILIVKVKKLYECINRSETMSNMTLKYSPANAIWCDTNRLEDKMSKIIYFIMIQATPVCVYVPWTVYIYFLYFTTDLGNAAFELPWPMWFPFNLKNPFGFFMGIIMQCTVFFYGMRISACTFVLAVVSYLYAITLSKIIKRCLSSINQSTQARADQSILLEQLIEFLNFDSNAKQLTSEFSGLYQHFIATVFIWSLVTICGALLMIQIQLTHHSDNFLVLLVLMVEVIYAFGAIFIACEMCQRINLAFTECSDMVDRFKWYLFPTKIQRILPMVLHFTQQPVEIKCFGSKAGDRDTFKSVIKTAYSYFSVLRQFYR